MREAEPHPILSFRTLPGNRWPPLPRPNVSMHWAAYWELSRSQWLSAAELEQRQLAQVRLLLEHCLHHVAYYRQTLRGLAPQDIRTLADFRQLPLLARPTYQARYPEFHAETLPDQTVRTGVANSSGTSGVPIEVQLTNVTSLWWLAFYLRDLEWSGIDPRGVSATIRTQSFADPERQRQFHLGLSQPCWNTYLDELIESGPSHGLDLHQDPAYQLQWLQHVQPTCLLSYPSNLAHLADLMQVRGISLPTLRVLQTFAETLHPQTEQHLKAVFGVPVKNLYSCAEAGYVASPCPLGHGLHVHAENVLLEVLDAQGQPCAPGAMGRVILTPLHNFATPLIRYDILDEVTPGPASCPCGRHLPLLLAVHGKQRPLLRFPGGRVRNSVGLVEALRNLGGVSQQQVVQRAIDHMLIRVVPSSGWSLTQGERIRHVAAEYCGADVRIEVEILPCLSRPTGGKLLEVVSELS